MTINVDKHLTRIPVVEPAKPIKVSVIRPKFKRPYAGVYSITNVLNKKKYIAAAFDVDREMRGEKLRLHAGTHRNKQLQEDYNAIGWRMFKIALVVKIRAKDLKNKSATEQYRMLDDLKKHWIKRLDSRNPDKGYNLKRGRKSV